MYSVRNNNNNNIQRSCTVPTCRPTALYIWRRINDFYLCALRVARQRSFRPRRITRARARARWETRTGGAPRAGGVDGGQKGLGPRDFRRNFCWFFFCYFFCCFLLLNPVPNGFTAFSLRKHTSARTRVCDTLYSVEVLRCFVVSTVRRANVLYYIVRATERNSPWKSPVRI